MTRVSAYALAIATAIVLASPADAQILDGDFRLFGHLTQGVGVAGDHPVHGVSTYPTTDLRTLALQIRYAVGDANEVVVQLKHQRLGISPLETIQDDLEMQWAFYQHRIGPWRVRAGRTPVPFGLFNEMRDVGTVLPFYRVPHHLYPEGTEAADGVVVAYQTGDPFGWNAQIEGFAGMTGYQASFYTPNPDFPVFVLDLRTKNAVGGQLWVGTPVPGLRLGAAGQSFHFMNEDREGAGGDGGSVWIGSLDGDFDRFLVRSEIAYTKLPSYNVQTAMAQVGAWATPKVGVFGQAEIVDVDDPATERSALRLSEDYAVALNLRMGPNLLLKLEGHHVKGYEFERWVDPTGPGLESMYGIASLSVSF